jgi:hypothetical protein
MTLEIPYSLSDIFFIIVIVMPGYFALFIFRWLAYLEDRWSDQEIILLSLTSSVFIYILTGYICNVTQFEEIRNIILHPNKAIILAGITILLGLLPGLAIRLYLHFKNISPGNTWVTALESAMDSDDDVWALIYTTDGKEYKGIINYYDTGEEPNSITISRPYQILRDENFYVRDEFEVGKEILFKEKDILRIILFNEI